MNAGAVEVASLGSPPPTAGTLETDQGSEGEATTGKPADSLAAMAATLLTLSCGNRTRSRTLAWKRSTDFFKANVF